MFKYFDIYDKGSVDFNDFMKAMEKIGLYYSPQELQPLFKQYDQDSSGNLDYKEFSAIIFGNDGPTVKGQMVKRPPAANQAQ
jgi:Ca2+-binding EF-hand superfamily protein